jgi:hypothetical protein
MSANPRRVLTLTLVSWGGCNFWVRPGAVADIPLGSALETAYGGSGNLSAVIPAGQRGQGDDLDRSAQAN